MKNRFRFFPIFPNPILLTAGAVMLACQTRFMRERYGVPESMMSRHIAVTDKSGQVIERHVPASADTRMRTHPAVKGLAVPGMPANSPGMGKMDAN